MKKWMIVLVGTLLLMMGILTVTATATDTVAYGYCGSEGDGTNVVWMLDSDGLLTISGTGAMKNYDRNNRENPWSRWYEVKAVFISDGVTSIGEYAFYRCSDMISATIGDGVTSIGQCAFNDCTRLTAVTIGKSVTNIQSRAFLGCHSLKSVVIPNSVVFMSDSFRNCSGLSDVTVPSSVTTMESTFMGCNNLKNAGPIGGNYDYKFGWSDAIPAYAFYECGIKSVTLPNSTTSIGEYAFSNCDNLTNITIPSGVTAIGEGAFNLCQKLNSISLPTQITSVKKDTFYSCTSLTSMIIPNSVTSIEQSAFDNCVNLKNVYYSGSAEQWNAISIGTYNLALTFAQKHYNSTGPASAFYNVLKAAIEPAPGDTEALRKAGEQRLNALYQSFEAAYNAYAAKMKGILTELGQEKQDTDTDYEKQARKLMATDQKTGYVSFTLGGAIGSNAKEINERAKLHAYMAVCQMLNEKADAKGLDFSKIGLSDPLSAESKIVTQIRNSLSHYNKTFDYSGSEVTICCLNAQVKKDRSAQFG